MAAPHTRLWTYDDYMRMADDGRRFEVIEGELIEMPAPRVRHQLILIEIVSILRDFNREHRLGTVLAAPCDVVFSPINIMQPDVFFVGAANMAIIEELNVQGAPDLCVEILSPGTAARDLAQKRRLYARFGVAEYWLVDPIIETVTVLTLDSEEYTVLVEATGAEEVRSMILPGFALQAATLFPA